MGSRPSRVIPSLLRLGYKAAQPPVAVVFFSSSTRRRSSLLPVKFSRRCCTSVQLLTLAALPRSCAPCCPVCAAYHRRGRLLMLLPPQPHAMAAATSPQWLASSEFPSPKPATPLPSPARVASPEPLLQSPRPPEHRLQQQPPTRTLQAPHAHVAR
jgi:hypothetical protein